MGKARQASLLLLLRVECDFDPDLSQGVLGRDQGAMLSVPQPQASREPKGPMRAPKPTITCLEAVVPQDVLTPSLTPPTG